MKFAVIVFPGSNCDHDAYHAVRHVLGQDAEFVWHKETDLKGADCAILPGGFSHVILESRGDEGDLDNTPEYVIEPGHYFMMGDNRDDSADSRVLSQVGYVPFENLIGRAQVIFFSVREGEHAWEVWHWPRIVRWDRLLTMAR